MNENLAEPKLIDRSVIKIINIALGDYLSGKTDEERTAKLINDKISMMLNE